MAAPPVIEIREPGQPVRRVTLDRAIEVGRECDGELVSDPGVSRRHLKLVPSPTSLSVVDLGSANGTSKNGHPVTSRTTLEQGDIVRLGDTEIVVLARPVVAKPVAGSRGTVMIRTLGPVAIPKPPPPKPVEVAPSQGSKLRDRVLGVGTEPDQPVFPNFMELPRHIPVPVWQVIRWLSIATYVALVVAPVHPSRRRRVRLLQGDRAAAAHPLLRRARPVAQHLPAGRLQPDAPGARLHPRPDGAGLVVPVRLRRRHPLVLRDHRRPPRAVQHEPESDRRAARGHHRHGLHLGLHVQGEERLVLEHLPAAAPAARSTGRRRSSPCRTATATRAWPARRTATTSTRGWPTRRTCTTPTPAGAPRARCSSVPSPATSSGSSC